MVFYFSLVRHCYGISTLYAIIRELVSTVPLRLSNEAFLGFFGIMEGALAKKVELCGVRSWIDNARMFSPFNMSSLQAEGTITLHVYGVYLALAMSPPC